MKDLIRRARAYDGDAFVELMERNKQSMYKIAKAYLKREEDVADAMSETVLDCFEHLADLKEDRYFNTWLVRILINNCKNILKQNMRNISLEEFPQLENNNEATENQEFIQYLAPLEDDEKLIMLLYYVWGFRTREISELLNRKESTIKSKILRSRGKIKQAFFPMLV